MAHPSTIATVARNIRAMHPNPKGYADAALYALHMESQTFDKPFETLREMLTDPNWDAPTDFGIAL